MDHSFFAGFYKKTIQERTHLLKALLPQINGVLQEGGLTLKTADLMIENCIGKLSLPLGLGLNFTINKKDYIVPMSTEEPSIVAAASGSAKIVKAHGGFRAASSAPIMRGQIQLLNVPTQAIQDMLREHKDALILKSNEEYCPRMVQRGGGVLGMSVRHLEPLHSVLEIHMNVCEAMGANIVNSVCESLSVDIGLLLPSAEVGLRILSNYCTERTVRASFRIPIDSLAQKGHSGFQVCRRILAAQRFAELDVYRACTHNKGILNGVSAVAVATGQDTRSIEAGAHAWASRSGRYMPLTSYRTDGTYFQGQLEMPLAVGTQGGAMRSNSVYANAHYMMSYPTAAELGQVMACVGLANNLASLRAMMTQGIQRGHMTLHSKNIAIAAGVPSDLVYEVVEYMKAHKRFDRQAALDYMEAHHLHTVSWNKKHIEKTLNTFYANLEDLSPPFKISIGFQCKNLKSVHVHIDKQGTGSQGLSNEIRMNLFGKHNYMWAVEFFGVIDKIKYTFDLPRENLEFRSTIKVVSVWLNLLCLSMLNVWDAEKTAIGLEAILNDNSEGLSQIAVNSPAHIEYGLFLSNELWYVLKSRIEQLASPKIPHSGMLATELLDEIKAVIRANIVTYTNRSLGFAEFFQSRKKHMCATVILLCDYFGSVRITPEGVAQAKVLGNLLETLSAASRDFKKYTKGATSPNAYCEWQRQSAHREGSVAESYFAYVRGILDQESGFLGSAQMDMLKKAKMLIENYYSSPKL